MQKKLFLSVLNGSQSGSIIDLNIYSTYTLANNFEHEIFLELDTDFTFSFTLQENEIIIKDVSGAIDLLSNGKLISIGQALPFNTVFSLKNIKFFIGFDLQDAHLDTTNHEAPKILGLDELLGDDKPLLKPPGKIYKLKIAAKEISDFIFTYLSIIYNASKNFYQKMYAKLGIWLYVIILVIIALFSVISTFIYQINSAQQEELRIENTLKSKKQIMNVLLNLPVKFHGVFLLDNKAGRYVIGGVVNTTADLDQLKAILAQKLKGVPLIYNVKLFNDIKSSVLQIMSQYGILSPQIEVFNNVNVGVTLKGIANNANDIDNLMIDIRNNLNYIDQINTDKIILKSQIDDFFNSFPADLKDQLDISEQLANGQITISGMLNDGQIAQLQDKIDKFNEKYDGLVHITTNFQNIISSLPFYITEIHFTDPKSIVTNDGTILYVGGTYDGVTVLNIDAGKVKLYKNFPIVLDINDIMELSLNHNKHNKQTTKQDDTSPQNKCGRKCIINEEQSKLADTIKKESSEINELNTMANKLQTNSLKLDMESNISELKTDLNEKKHEYNYYKEEK